MEREKSRNRTLQKKITLLLAIILLLLSVVFYFLVRQSGANYKWLDFTNDLIKNLLGLFITLLIFNVFYEYLLKDCLPDEISEKITETIMLNRLVVDSFNNSTKENFIKTTLESVLQKESGEVIYMWLEPYLKSKINLRKNLKYRIIIEEILDNKDTIFHSQDYVFIREGLSYDKIFTDKVPEHINIGFFLNGVMMEDCFKKEEYFFRENFSIKAEHLQTLKNYSADQKLDFINNYMKIKTYINEEPLEINFVMIDDSGIIINYKNIPDLRDRSIKLDLQFAMPQLKSKNIFSVILPEPTYQPRISFHFPKDELEVKAIPFFDENYESKLSVTELDGVKEFELNNWVLPRSGVVFVWEKRG